MGGEGSLNSFSKLSPRYHLFDITLGGAQTGVGSNVFVYVYAHLNVLLPDCPDIGSRTLHQSIAQGVFRAREECHVKQGLAIRGE